MKKILSVLLVMSLYAGTAVAQEQEADTQAADPEKQPSPSENLEQNTGNEQRKAEEQRAGEKEDEPTRQADENKPAVFGDKVDDSGTDALENVLKALDKPLQGVDKLAVIRPEATGTAEDLSGLEERIETYLSSKEGIEIITADEVFTTAGPEFAVSPEGIAGVAQKTGAVAALFPRVFKTPHAYEVHLWIVDGGGKVLIDEAIEVQSIPPGTQVPPETASAKPAPVHRAPPAQAVQDRALEPEPEPEPEPRAENRDLALEAFQRRALSLAPRQRVSGHGASVGFAAGNVAFGVHSSPVIKKDWMIMEGAEPISELRLAELSGNEEIERRIKDSIETMTTYRNVGIGMTLGGFLAAGIAAPFFKQGCDEGLTTAGVVVGVGTAVGAAGLVMWLVYGPQAASAQSPYPRNHKIDQAEAEEMIERYNNSLRRELLIEESQSGSATGPQTPAARFTIFPDPRGGASAGLYFEF